MATQIIGGRKNTPMVVGNDGRGRVLSVNQSSDFNAALNEEAFAMLAEVNLTGSALEPLLYIKNTKIGLKSGMEQVLCVNDIMYSSDANIHFEIFVEETYTSGGTSVMPRNVFVGSTRTAEVTAYDNSSNDLILASDGTEIESFFMSSNSMYRHNYNGALILRNQKTLTIKAQGANTNKVRASIQFFYVSLAASE